MSVRVEVVCVNPDGSEQRREVLAIEARQLAINAGLILQLFKFLELVPMKPANCSVMCVTCSACFCVGPHPLGEFFVPAIILVALPKSV